jgi:hydrogenase maturation protease
VNAPRDTASLVVLGLGNVLCGDDGLGVTAVATVAERYALPPEVALLDGGTLGLSLLGWLEAAQDLLLVDAVRTDDPPGTLVRLEGEDVAPAARDRLSVHQVGVADLLDGLHLLDAWPRRLSLIGLVPEALELGLNRSDRVERRIPDLVEAVVAEIRDRGYPLVARGDDEAPVDVLDTRHAARALGL